MPRKPQVGTCSDCGQEKPLFDVKNKRCGSCAGKRGGGRPKALVKKEKDPLPLGSEHTPSDDTTKSKSESGTAPQPPEDKYLCDACGKEVRYGQRQCRCGCWCDWRGTPVLDDPDLVVCPECGAICGHVDNATKCPHCNYGDA